MKPLTTIELERRLDALLNPVLSSRRTAAPLAHGIAQLTPEWQAFALHWVQIISRTNYELAYQFAAATPVALVALDVAGAEAWIIQAMDSYDRQGLLKGSEAFKHFADFSDTARNQQAVSFREAAPILELFVRGLSGRSLKIESAPAAWTDTETLYLPARMTLGASRHENFLLYKFMATLLWAQSRYGTFAEDLNAVVSAYADPARALEWLGYLEALRLESQIARALPGLVRDMQEQAGLASNSTSDDARFAPLRAMDATVRDSIALLRHVRLEDSPPYRAWLGALHPAEASVARAARLNREKSALQEALAGLLDERRATAGDKDAGQETLEFSVNTEKGNGADVRFELMLGGDPVVPPEPVRDLLDSILHDLDHIPDDYLDPRHASDAATGAGETPSEPADQATPADVMLYDEWDFQRRHYRKNWCTVREVDVAPDDSAFVDATLQKYAAQVTQLRRSFEMLRAEDRVARRMKHGDDIDLDAFIPAYAEMQAGQELSERLFTKRQKSDRNLAVLFMVDMSGSTKGWINDAERETLVLLSEALEVLGDRYAIYGFSGVTRKRCEIFRIKRFDEPYIDAVRQRIAGVRPRDYTRMGVAIRHLTTLLDAIDARTRVLITLSDGKPDDYSDHYRGDYGIEDTRQALLEAQRAGIKPFCITIDREARDYLPHMYGAANWTLVDDVARLPLKVAEIYRRITT